MLFSTVGAPVTSAGMFGDTSLGFGLSFSGAYGAAAVASSKILQLLGCIWMLIGNVTTVSRLYSLVSRIQLVLIISSEYPKGTSILRIVEEWKEIVDTNDITSFS